MLLINIIQMQVMQIKVTTVALHALMHSEIMRMHGTKLEMTELMNI